MADKEGNSVAVVVGNLVGSSGSDHKEPVDLDWLSLFGFSDKHQLQQLYEPVQGSFDVVVAFFRAPSPFQQA